MTNCGKKSLQYDFNITIKLKQLGDHGKCSTTVLNEVNHAEQQHIWMVFSDVKSLLKTDLKQANIDEDNSLNSDIGEKIMS